MHRFAPCRCAIAITVTYHGMIDDSWIARFVSLFYFSAWSSSDGRTEQLHEVGQRWRKAVLEMDCLENRCISLLKTSCSSRVKRGSSSYLIELLLLVIHRVRMLMFVLQVSVPALVISQVPTMWAA